MLELCALGVADLRRSDGREIEVVLSQPKRFALLVYLATSGRRGTTSRDVLLATFWPDLDKGHSRQSLNQALRFLRRALGADAIVSRGEDAVALDLSAMRFDVRMFDEACEQGDAERAMALYRGDFLDGFFVTEASAGLDEWMANERARLREAATVQMWCLADRCRSAGRPEVARDWARRAVALAPDDERGVRRLVQLLEGLGDRSGAIREYERFAARLQREFGIEPSSQSRALLASIRAEERSDRLAVTVSKPDPDPIAVARPNPAESASAMTVSAPRTRMARRHVSLVLFAGIAAIGSAIVGAFGRDRPLMAASPRVAVATFRNATGDHAFDMLGRLAADRMTDAIQRSGLAGVVLGATTIASTTRAGGDRPAAETTARELRRLTGADLVIVGSYYLLNDSLRYEVALVDAVDGTLRGTPVSVTVSSENVTDGLDIVRERVAGTLATALDPRFRSSVAVSSSSPTIGAFEEYVVGLDAFDRRKDADAALAHLERASARDSSYVTPLLTMVGLYHATGQFARADSVAAVVERGRRHLSGFERLQLDRFQSLLRGDIEGAYTASAKLATLAPRSHFVQMLAMDASWTLRLRESIDVLMQLDPTSSWVSGWQDYWATLAYDLHDLGEYDRELAIARRARSIQPNRLRFLWLEVEALIGLGRLDDVRARLSESLTIRPPSAESRRDAWNPGVVMRNAALELRAHGHRRLAHEVLERGHAWYASRPREEQNDSVRRYNRMQRLEELERWPDAAALADSILSARGGFARAAHAVLGKAAAVRGDFQRAHAEMAVLSGDAPADLYASAEIAARLGDRKRALDLLEDAYAHGQRHMFWDHLIASFEPLRDDARYRALMRPREK